MLVLNDDLVVGALSLEHGASSGCLSVAQGGPGTLQRGRLCCSLLFIGVWWRSRGARVWLNGNPIIGVLSSELGGESEELSQVALGPCKDLRNFMWKTIKKIILFAYIIQIESMRGANPRQMVQ